LKILKQYEVSLVLDIAKIHHVFQGNPWILNSTLISVQSLACTGDAPQESSDFNRPAQQG
jgi:hypothetical protein